MLTESLGLGTGTTRCLDQAVRQFVTGLAGASDQDDPVEFAQRCGVEPDRWQAGILRSRSRQVCLLCARQTGKSLAAALCAVHTAVTEPGALVLLVAPSVRQAQELYRKARTALTALGRAAPPTRQESALSLEFSTGARIVVIPGDERTVRGFSNVALLVVDEAARISDALYFSLRPMLAVSGGRIVLLSTPFGKRGAFFQEYTEGGPDWHRVKVTADQCPRIDPAWLKAERERISDWWYRQEYLCHFVSTDDQVFDYDLLMRAVSSDVAPLFPSGRVAA